MIITLSRRAEKSIRKVPVNVLRQLDLWRLVIKKEGVDALLLINGFRDHALKGKRLGQRSSSLSRSWRVVYIIEDEEKTKITVLEVSHHDY